MYRLLPYLILAVCLSCSFGKLRAQEDSTVLQAVVVDGDTVPMVILSEFSISDRRLRQSKRYERKYGRIRKKVIKAYPYAKVTEELLQNYEEELAKLEQKKERKDYLNLAEKELKEEFEGEIKNLTVSEGKILIKLIDRQTDKTSYSLIKDLKGGFSAFMWQGVAKLFGTDLKSEYDPDGDDQIIEEIVQQIEQGDIYVPPRAPVTTKAQKRLEKKRLRREDRRRTKLGEDTVQD